MDEERMEIPPQAPVEVWLAGALTILLMVFGLSQVFYALRDPALADVPTTIEDIRSGVSSDKFSKHLDTHLPLRQSLIATANAGRYIIFQGTGDDVRLGRDEWLFSVEEIKYEAQSEAWIAQRLDTVSRVSQLLEQTGIRLIVALLPDKARVHEAQLASGMYPAWYAHRYDAALQKLRASGVHTVDALSVLDSKVQRKPMFYSTDTHWNQDGADLVAKAVASRVRELVPNVPEVQFKTESSAASETRAGDLLRLIGLSDVPDWLRPNPDVERVQITVPVSDKAQGGLMDDSSVPVVLVGTSYSRRANFHGALQQNLSAEVLNMAKDGGGFATSMKEYLNGEEFSSSPPKVLVWEIPERMLSQPLSDADKKGWPF
jgi:alginate O-acetyltransferase complex protein AlgJ